MKTIIITDEIEKEFLKYIYDGRYNEFVLLADIKKYFEYLQDKIKREIDLKEILVSKNLNNLIDKYSKFFKSNKQVDDKVKNAYKSLREKWGYKIVELTKTDVCPYCNRNFTFNFNEKKTTVELDHYYPKDKYPYLALNLYNLVPSCHTCNHKKNNNEKIHLHPFFDDIDKEIKFSLKLKKANFYHSIDGFKIEIEGKSQKAQNHIDIFNLEPLYNEHRDIVLELIQKKYMYNESYLDELLRKYEGTFFKNKEDLLRLISGGFISEDEINKRPLSKLIKDIMEEIY